MIHIYSTASVKSALFLIAVMATAATHASLLDCTTSPYVDVVADAPCTPIEPLVDESKTYILEEAIPAQPIKAVLAGFQVNQTRATSALPESAPLVVLIGALLAVLLVRAKSCNTK
jgi:hypothetical protein